MTKLQRGAVAVTCSCILLISGCIAPPTPPPRWAGTPRTVVGPGGDESDAVSIPVENRSDISLEFTIGGSELSLQPGERLLYVAGVNKSLPISRKASNGYQIMSTTVHKGDSWIFEFKDGSLVRPWVHNGQEQ